MKQITKITYEDICIETFPVGTLACNCSIIYSLTTKDAIIIDPGNDAKLLLGIIKDKDLKVKSLVHTHAHFDHIGRSNTLKRSLNCPMYLHRDDLLLYQALKQQGLFFGEEVDEPMPLDGFIENGQEFELNSKIKPLKIFTTIHIPGHTPGSCCFHMDNTTKPILFSGDTLFKESIGRTDFPGGDHDKIIKSIKNHLLPLDDTTVCIPGHGKITTIAHEKNHNSFL